MKVHLFEALATPGIAGTPEFKVASRCACRAAGAQMSQFQHIVNATLAANSALWLLALLFVKMDA